MRKDNSKATVCLGGHNMIDLGDLRPDQDEIRTYHHTHNIRTSGISIGTAIVLAAIIGIGGFWGGKVGYQLFQEWRAERAMQELARDAQRAMEELTQAAQRHAQVQARQQRQQSQRAAQARQDRIWNSRECRFWWEHAPNDPKVIAKAKTMQSCR